jgi:hypothetical protein
MADRDIRAGGPEAQDSLPAIPFSTRWRLFLDFSLIAGQAG